jgi:hypothetical protein
MKPGQEVTYVSSNDERHDAVVVAVVGTDESGYKRLDVSVDGQTFKDVPHLSDGEAYWQLPSEKPPEPEFRSARDSRY